jgi:hypothetical protein
MERSSMHFKPVAFVYSLKSIKKFRSTPLQTACGRDVLNVLSTPYINRVTCKTCKKTRIYKSFVKRNKAMGSYELKIALNRVKEEVLRDRKKFEPFNSPHEGYAVILEELDELWDEVKKGTQDPAAMFKEAKQVAAMAICFMLECT